MRTSSVRIALVMRPQTLLEGERRFHTPCQWHRIERRINWNIVRRSNALRFFSKAAEPSARIRQASTKRLPKPTSTLMRVSPMVRPHTSSESRSPRIYSVAFAPMMRPRRTRGRVLGGPDHDGGTLRLRDSLEAAVCRGETSALITRRQDWPIPAKNIQDSERPMEHHDGGNSFSGTTSAMQAQHLPSERNCRSRVIHAGRSEVSGRW